MSAFRLTELLARRADAGRPYLEFIRVPNLSVGLYVLPARGIDRQQPHGEDEVYHVLSGRGRITVGDEVVDIEPGTVVFVAAEVPHRFHDIEEELVLFVAFGPAEDSRRG